MLNEWLLWYGLLGLFVGFFAGLFGIGGGLILVPVLFWCFEVQQLAPAYHLHLALGTSMAAIIFSASYSSYTHHQYGAVDFSVVRRMALGLLCGTLCGGSLASQLDVRPLALIFSGFVCLAALQMLLNIKPRPSRQLPSLLGLSVAGGGIGFISSLVSIGGGVLSVPFLLHHNIPLRQAIATSAALGLPIALGGTVAYVLNGVQQNLALNGNWGFVYLPALLMLSLASLITTPLGAKATHRLPVTILKPAFAVLLLLLAAKMSWQVFY